MPKSPWKPQHALTQLLLDGQALSRHLESEFKPKTDEARCAVEGAVVVLAEQAMRDVRVINHDAIRTIEQMISAIDSRLSAQINLILHHPTFQAVESAWRGLHYLVSHTESDQYLKVRFMNVSKAELAKTLKRHKGVAWDQSPVFKKIYEAEYGQFGGEPYGCLVGDYQFDHSPPDVEMLGELSKVCAAAHAPFLSAVSPSTWNGCSAPSTVTCTR